MAPKKELRQSTAIESLNESTALPAIILIAEPGKLARQAELLVRSLRLNGGRLAQAPILVYHNLRPNRLPLPATNIERLESMGAEVISPKVRNNAFAALDYVNKLVATSDASERRPNQALLWLDSDIICLQEPSAILDATTGMRAAACPVVRRGIANLRSKPLSNYWKIILELAEIDPAQFDWSVTAGSGEDIYPYINGGVVWITAGHDGFQQACHAAHRLTPLGLRMVANKYQRHFFDQAIWTACLIRGMEDKSQFLQLAYDHNFPIRKVSEHGTPEDITMLHYHRTGVEDLDIDLNMRPSELLNSICARAKPDE